MVGVRISLVIEDICDDELGIIAASRSYACRIDAGDTRVIHLGPDFRVSGHRIVNGDDVCMTCERGPILWDPEVRLPYVLVPFVIWETP